jgi:hypothetical protein
MAARARNALRRPMFIGVVSIITFIASLVALVVVPQQARRTAAQLRPIGAQRPDTEPTVAALHEAERQVTSADSAIVAARNDISQLIAMTAAAGNVADTMATGEPIMGVTRTARDSLATQVAQLGRLLARAENAPLLGSYRALAEAPAMRGDASVRQLLDSLVEIERERESYNAVGGVDPVFVALTARANELGRAIEAVAIARRADLRRQMAALAPPPPALAAAASRPVPDTTQLIAAAAAARSAAAGVANRLTRERAELTQLDAREGKARELANLGASPSAMLAAALIFGAVIGFGFALVDEIRHPRIADGYEAERATGVRVLGVISPLPPSPERGRRSTDRAAPPYIDPGADGHQLIYLHIAAAGANVLMLTVTGDNPAVSAVVAINFAAIAADEARSTLLIDTDAAASTVTAALRLRPGEGLSGLVSEKLSWPEAVRSARIGRESSIDVVPTGPDAPTFQAVSTLLQNDAVRLARRYDTIVIVSAAEQVVNGLPSVLPIPDVIYCVRSGQTPIAKLKRALDDIERTGGRIRGIVLWNAPDPVLSELRAVEQGAEPVPATV